MTRCTIKAAIVTMLGLAGAAHAQISFNPINDFGVTDQSADGTWLVGTQGSNIVRWSANTGFETLYIDANYNGSPGISDDGSRVTGTIYDSEGTAVPGVWTEGIGWVTTGPIPGGGVPNEDGSAYAISGDGSTITGLAWRSDWRARAFRSPAPRPFRWCAPARDTSAPWSCWRVRGRRACAPRAASWWASARGCRRSPRSSPISPTSGAIW